MAKLRIGTSEPDSTFHRQAVAIGEIWREEGIAESVETLYTEGSVENAEMVAAGRADYACMAANWLAPAATGKPPFKRPLPVRLATPINSGPLFFAARSDSPLQTFSDLRGRRIALGVANSGMVQHFQGMVKALGLSLDQFEPSYVGVAEGARMLAEGSVDAQFQPPIPNIAFTALCERTPVKALPFSAAERKRILEAVPYYAEATIEAKSFRGQTDTVTTVAVVNVLGVHEKAEAEGVYRTVSALIRRADELARRNALFHGLSDLLRQSGRRIIPVLAKAGAAQHPGASRAFKEAGLLA